MAIELSRDNSIFRDEDVLRDSYQPETLEDIQCRDDELEKYKTGVMPIINNAEPNNIFVYGRTGVGKTLTTDLMTDKLHRASERYDDLNIRTEEVQCKSLSSSYQVAIRLVNKFKDDDNKLSTRGYDSAEVYEHLWEELNKIDNTHVIFVLDEVDSIGTDDDLLYELPRCASNGLVEGTNVGVIGISNDYNFVDNLSERVKDTLCEYEIEFTPYDASQLQYILEQRADLAFYDGAVGDAEVRLASALAGQDSGSARHALQLLKMSGEIARARDEDRVTEDHVREANDEIERNKLRDALKNLPTQSHLTLHALLCLSESGEIPAKRKEIYGVYTDIAEELNVSPKSIRTIHKQLKQMSMNGFLRVEEKNRGPRGGSYYQYSFDMSEDVVKEVLRNNTRVSEIM